MVLSSGALTPIPVLVSILFLAISICIGKTMYKWPIPTNSFYVII